VPRLGTRTRADKDAALYAIADRLVEERGRILDANRADQEMALAAGTRDAMLDRLRLDDARIESMANAVREVAALDDPVGQVVETRARPNGLTVTRVRVPLGLVAMIYEARPNVTAEAAALTLKAGNAVVLRGGS
jgi:glutamate-5-semialdehyde dehydrogenase